MASLGLGRSKITALMPAQIAADIEFGRLDSLTDQDFAEIKQWFAEIVAEKHGNEEGLLDRLSRKTRHLGHVRDWGVSQKVEKKLTW